MAGPDKQRRKELRRQYESLQEDCRPLAAFYPDASTRHSLHYAFAHRFLPHYVHQNPRAFSFEEKDPTRYIQSRWAAIFEPEATASSVNDWFERMNVKVFRRLADLSMSIHECAGWPIALIRMSPTTSTSLPSKAIDPGVLMARSFLFVPGAFRSCATPSTSVTLR
jgi:hypothetical protein